jgi:hypothetical protein
MFTLNGCPICNDKMVGEHLECSPCGTVTGPHGGVALMAVVLPEVLLSLLSKKWIIPNPGATRVWRRLSKAYF